MQNLPNHIDGKNLPDYRDSIDSKLFDSINQLKSILSNLSGLPQAASLFINAVQDINLLLQNTYDQIKILHSEIEENKSPAKIVTINNKNPQSELHNIDVPSGLSSAQSIEFILKRTSLEPAFVDTIQKIFDSIAATIEKDFADTPRIIYELIPEVERIFKEFLNKVKLDAIYDFPTTIKTEVAVLKFRLQESFSRYNNNYNNRLEYLLKSKTKDYQEKKTTDLIVSYPQYFSPPSVPESAPSYNDTEVLKQNIIAQLKSEIESIVAKDKTQADIEKNILGKFPQIVAPMIESAINKLEAKQQLPLEANNSDETAKKISELQKAVADAEKKLAEFNKNFPPQKLTPEIDQAALLTQSVYKNPKNRLEYFHKIIKSTTNSLKQCALKNVLNMKISDFDKVINNWNSLEPYNTKIRSLTDNDKWFQNLIAECFNSQVLTTIIEYYQSSATEYDKQKFQENLAKSGIVIPYVVIGNKFLALYETIRNAFNHIVNENSSIVDDTIVSVRVLPIIYIPEDGVPSEIIVEGELVIKGKLV